MPCGSLQKVLIKQICSWSPEACPKYRVKQVMTVYNSYSSTSPTDSLFRGLYTQVIFCCQSVLFENTYCTLSVQKMLCCMKSGQVMDYLLFQINVPRGFADKSTFILTFGKENANHCSYVVGIQVLELLICIKNQIK